MRLPNEFVPREISDPRLKDLLNNFSNCIDEVVDYGTHILKIDLDSVQGSDEQIPIIFSIRQIIDLADSISILIKNSSIDSCKLILRGLLETCFGIEYMLEGDTVERCMAFMVWHAHKNMKVYERINSTKEPGKQLQSTLNDDKLLNGIEFGIKAEFLDGKYENLCSLLKRPEYQKAEQEFQNLKKLKIKNPAWYQFYSGPKSIQELAKYLKLSGMYELLYRNLSGPIHGTDIFQGKLSGNENQLEVLQLRFAGDARSIYMLTVNLTIMTYSTYVEKRLPNNYEEFKKWKEQLKI